MSDNVYKINDRVTLILGDMLDYINYFNLEIGQVDLVYTDQKGIF